MRKIVLLSFLFVYFSTYLFSQLSEGGTPISFQTFKANVFSNVKFEEMPLVDEYALREEDKILDTLPGMPWRFGFNHEVDLNPDNSGFWDIIPGQGRLWRLALRSTNAKTINLTFNRYKLPDGAKLFIYNEDKSVVLGAFTSKNNQEHGYFSTTLIPGEAITIEYFEPFDVDFEGELNLMWVTHGYRGPYEYAKGFGSSGACNLNVACPQAAGWEDQIRSVCMLVSGGNGFCTGTLINNTNLDGKPYILTADHCYSNPASWVFWFNWQSATCTNPPSSPPYNSLNGATLRARNSASDFCLVEINTAVPQSFNAYWSGWNRTTELTLNETIVGIHHPSGDIKKFSYSTTGVTSANYLGNPGSGTNHWRIQWSGGTTTEGGSSGSALYDSNKRIIGQLHGGYAACGNTQPDYYGKLGVSWTGGGTTTTRLSDWLDPTNSGVMVLDGFDPYAIVCTPPTQQATNFSSSDIQDNQMTIGWTRGNGNQVLVVARKGAAVSGNPSNGVSYTANASFGSGSSLGADTYVVYKGTGTSVTVTNLLPGTTYHFAIYEFFTADNCYNTSALTGSASTTGTAPCVYCTVSATTDDNTGITKVIFNTIDNTSTGAPGYTDYTNISTDVVPGQQYQLSVRVNTDGNYTVQTRAWIDWNKNCTFDAGEEYNLGSATNTANGLTSLSPLTITVPANAVLGPTTMRIRTVYGNTVTPLACGNQNYSEAEDYTINVIAGGVFANFSANPLTVEVGQPVTFTDASGGGTITSWAWIFGDGANPATATGQGPHQVTYNTPGQKTISLTVNGDITETKANYITVNEPCNVINSFPWQEIFNQAELPNCWSKQQTHSTNTWTSTTGYTIGTSTNVGPQTGSHFWYVQWIAQNQNEWLITPAFDFSNLTNPVISFWFNGSYNWSVINNNCDLDLMVQVNGGTWTKIWGETDHPNWITNDATYVWQKTVIPLTAYAGQNNVKFAFRYTGNDGANFAVDNVRIYDDNTTQEYTLTINIFGQGSVNVNGTPYINTLSFQEGTNVNLQALAQSGWQFSYWSGDATGTNTTISVNMNSNKNITANFSTITLVSNDNFGNISIYPNPAEDRVLISSEYKFFSVKISNIAGQLLKQIDVHSNKAEFSIDEFANGIYLIQIEFKDYTINRKLIIKK